MFWLHWWQRQGGVLQPQTVLIDLTDFEQVPYDPKDGNLSLGGARSESLVDTCSNFDVQIDCQTQLYGQKTNRSI